MGRLVSAPSLASLTRAHAAIRAHLRRDPDTDYSAADLTRWCDAQTAGDIAQPLNPGLRLTDTRLVAIAAGPVLIVEPDWYVDQREYLGPGAADPGYVRDAIPPGWRLGDPPSPETEARLIAMIDRDESGHVVASITVSRWGVVLYSDGVLRRRDLAYFGAAVCIDRPAPRKNSK